MNKGASTLGLAKVLYTQDMDYEVVINKGEKDGVEKGDLFLVYGLGPELFDPDTNESLGRLEVVRGKGRAVHIQDRITTLRSIEAKKIAPTRRVIKEDSFRSLLMPKTIEEHLPGEADELPFRDVEKGDLAKPI